MPFRLIVATAKKGVVVVLLLFTWLVGLAKIHFFFTLAAADTYCKYLGTTLQSAKLLVGWSVGSVGSGLN